MPSRRDEIIGRPYFNSVQEFWDAGVSGWLPGTIRQGSFVGQLLRGIVENGQLREMQPEDVESGTQPDTLIVVRVQESGKRPELGPVAESPAQDGQVFGLHGRGGECCSPHGVSSRLG